MQLQVLNLHVGPLLQYFTGIYFPLKCRIEEINDDFIFWESNRFICLIRKLVITYIRNSFDLIIKNYIFIIYEKHIFPFTKCKCDTRLF